MRKAYKIKLMNYEIKEGCGPTVSHSSAMYNIFEDIAPLAQETFHVALFNQKNKLIDRFMISLGSLTASLVHPREVFRPAIMEGAAAIAIAHNHPSGEVTPSEEDRKVTRRMAEAGTLLGIRLLDHLIIGNHGQFYSFQDEGLI